MKSIVSENEIPHLVGVSENRGGSELDRIQGTAALHLPDSKRFGISAIERRTQKLLAMYSYE